MEYKKPFEKQIHWIIIFGLIWGITEIFLGKWLKMLQPALFGILMPFFTLIVVLTSKRFAPVPGSILLMALIAAPLKFFFSEMILHGAFMAMILEAFLIEFALGLFGFNWVAFVTGGVFVELYSLFHPLLSRGVFCQSSHFILFKRWLENLIDPGSAKSFSDSSVTLVLLVSHLIMGVLAGIWVWLSIRYFIREKT